MNAVLIGVLIAAAIFVSVGVWRFVLYRGPRIVLCPETGEPAGVEVDAWLAAREPDEPLRLASCSRWPKEVKCGQECVAQIEAAPRATRAKNRRGVLSR